MEYLVMECGLSYAVVMDGTGRFWKVPNLGYTVGQTLEDVVRLPAVARWRPVCVCFCWEVWCGSHPSERCGCRSTPTCS